MSLYAGNIIGLISVIVAPPGVTATDGAAVSVLFGSVSGKGSGSSIPSDVFLKGAASVSTVLWYNCLVLSNNPGLWSFGFASSAVGEDSFCPLSFAAFSAAAAAFANSSCRNAAALSFAALSAAAFSFAALAAHEAG